MIENANNYLLSTMDNPYNPFIDWDSWYSYDESHGYRTCQVLDIHYKTSDLISESLDEYLYSLALEEIMDLYPYYVLISRETKVKPVDIDVLEEKLGISSS